MSIENPAPAHPPQDAPESRSTAERGGGNTRRSAAVSPTGDRITVQRVTSTVAGEYREWTVTVRQSSPADRPASELTRAGAVAVLPTPVRDWLSAWLEGRMVHAGEHIVPRDLLAAALGQPDPCGTRVVSGGGVRSACLLPVGHDGDHQPSAHTAAPLFPITEPEPAAPYAGRTAPRRTLPPEAPVRLWNREHTDHLDVIGRADSGRTSVRGARRIRLAGRHAGVARAWLAGDVDTDGHVFVVWLDREWTLAGYGSDGSRLLTLDLLPIPKPPRVDEVLGHEPGAKAVSPYTDLGQVLTKGERFAVEWPDGTSRTYTYSGDPANPVADEPDRAGRFSRKVEAMGRAMAAATEPPCAFPHPDRILLCDRPEGHQGPHNAVDKAHSGGRVIIWTDRAELGTAGPGSGEPVGTVTSGLIHATPEPCGSECEGYTCAKPSGHVGNHTTGGRTWADVPDVDEVLPMPGSPNDKLAQAADGRSRRHELVDQHGACGALNANRVLFCTMHAGHVGPHVAHDSRDTRVATWPAGHLADLYARLPYLHDAVAEEDQ